MANKVTNINIFKFRVIIDTEEDVFRDIEIETHATFEELHKAILDAFDFEEGEMASFYLSDEKWEKGLEIPLMEMSRDHGSTRVNMKTTRLNEMVSQPSEKILYVYDFLRMWCFYIELVEVKKDKPSTIYPRVAMVFGEAPSQESKELDLFGVDYDQEEMRNADEDEDGSMQFEGEDEYFDEESFDGSYRDNDDY